MNEIVGDNGSWSSGSEDGDTDDGSGGHVSTDEEKDDGPGTLTGHGGKIREMRRPHLKTSIWKQMETMTLEESLEGPLIEVGSLGGKRKRHGEEDSDDIRVVKRKRSVEKLISDMLAELDDTVSVRWETHCGDWKKGCGKEAEEGEKEEEEDLFLRMLLD